MSKTCIQCGKKIGFFQKPVDEIYCSMDCSALAQHQIAETEQRAAKARAEQQQAAAAAAVEQAAHQADEQGKAERRVSCPKCARTWAVTVDREGRIRGQCVGCGFSALFVDIGTCPSCNGETLVIESERIARCPRCKYRRD